MAREIVGIEKNPDAHFFALKSLQANRRIKNVIFHLGDVEKTAPLLSKTFDRVLLPLPRTAERHLGTALSMLRRGGTLHFYDFQTIEKRFLSVEKVRQASSVEGRLLKQAQVAVCGHVSSRTYRICVDALIQ
jgi:tRNA G37 N-methylase Trm5